MMFDEGQLGMARVVRSGTARIGPWYRIWPDVVMHSITGFKNGPAPWYLRSKLVRHMVFKLQVRACKWRGPHALAYFPKA